MQKLAFVVGVLVAAIAPAGASPTSAPIIGGEETSVGDYPTVVGLTIGQGLCTGTLIDPEWILTAAHCITPALVGASTQEQVTASTRVHFDTIDLSRPGGTVVGATLTLPKAGFSVNNLGQHDIGLIKLERPVTNVPPTPVNLVAAKAPVGLQGFMVGFGDTKTGVVGKQFELMNRTSTSCTNYGLSNTNLLCFAQGDAKGKCQGDSGGPTFAMIEGRMTVVGVTSFGDRNCAVFGADTRTDIERDFLLQHVPALECKTDDDCAGESLCFHGKCIAQPFSPTGIGTACTSGADCQSTQCAQAGDEAYCTEQCTPAAEGACPTGFECLASEGVTGICWAEEEEGGCCSGSAGAPTALFGLGLVALVLRRRRR